MDTSKYTAFTQAKIVALASYVNSVYLNFIFPFLPRMILDFQLADQRSEAGYYAWMLISGVFFARAIASPIFGWIIDKKGCKSALIFCCTSLAIFSVLFGLSENLIQAAVFRMCLGLTCPIPLITKTVMANFSSTKEAKTQYMSWLSLNIYFGEVSGLFVGGLLAHPEDLFDLSPDSIIVQYPYLLPNLVIAAISLIAAVSIYVVYEEKETPAVVSEEQPAGYCELISQKNIILVVLQNAMLNISFTCIQKLYALWFYSGTEHGGLSLDPHQIGMLLGFPWLIVMIAQHYGLTGIIIKRGLLWATEICFWMLAIQTLVIPLTSYVFEYVYLAYGILVFLTLWTYALSFQLMVTTSVLVNNAVTLINRGKLNALNVANHSLLVSLVTPLISILFAYSSNSGWPFPFNHCFAFIMLGTVSLIGVCLSRMIPKELEIPPDAELESSSSHKEFKDEEN